MKSYIITKQSRKYSTNNRIRSTSNRVAESLKQSFNAARKVVYSVSNIISYSFGMILLIIIILFVGVFASLSENTIYGTPIVQLSEEVLAYSDIINQYAIEYDIEEYTALIKAIMMEETKGIGNDPMNIYKLNYTLNESVGISNTEYSIETGIQYLSKCIKKADVKSPDDYENLHLAIQAYNYGLEYIDWAIDNFGGYSRDNAKIYFDMKKNESDIKEYGNVNYVSNVLQYYSLRSTSIVEIAKSQIGNIGGEKYWRWYGFDSRVEWCACFVSWCANESGDLDKNIPRFSRVEDGIEWFKNKNRWEDTSYLPVPGDLIFFDWDSDNDPDHVGIVEKVMNNKIFTIEGNSKNRCRNKEYRLDYECIVGYGMNSFIYQELLKNSKIF